MFEKVTTQVNQKDIYLMLKHNPQAFFHCENVNNIYHFIAIALLGVKKVRRHCNIPFNFIMDNNTISEIYSIKTHFNISMYSIIEPLQFLF